jgi:tRNA threonylcarbamoyladenosine biosynthesis protein TsaB
MLIIAIDTSGALCSVTIIANGIILSEKKTGMNRGHANTIMPMIQNALVESDIPLSEFGYVVTSTGPGSFTGLRIGMAAAKGLAISNDIPLIGISCFDAVAERTNPQGSSLSYDVLVIALNSKREQLYVECRAMDHTKLISGTVIDSDIFYKKIKTIIDKDTKIRLVGDGANQLFDQLPNNLQNNFLPIEETDIGPVAASDLAYFAAKTIEMAGTISKKYTPGLALNYFRSPDVGIAKK